MAQNTLTWENTRKVLEEFSERVIQAYKRELGSRGKMASGKLAEDLHYKIQRGGSIISVVLSLSEYWKYVEYGRKAGGKFPPPDVIAKWIEIKPILPRPDNKGKLPTISQLTYLIGRKIAEKGIPATNALSLSVEAVYNDMVVELGKAIAEDVNREIHVTLFR